MYYKQMYFLLFNAITDAIEALEHTDTALARRILISAQQQAEVLYINGEEKDNSR